MYFDAIELKTCLVYSLLNSEIWRANFPHDAPDYLTPFEYRMAHKPLENSNLDRPYKGDVYNVTVFKIKKNIFSSSEAQLFLREVKVKDKLLPLLIYGDSDSNG